MGWLWGKNGADEGPDEEPKEEGYENGTNGDATVVNGEAEDLTGGLRQRRPTKENKQLVVESHEIPAKKIGEEVRGAKDLQNFAQAADVKDALVSMVLLDVEAEDPSTLVDEVIGELCEHYEFEEEWLPAAREALLLENPLNQQDVNGGSVEAPTEASWHRYIQGSGYLVTYAKLHGLSTRVMALARLKNPACMGARNSYGLTQFVVIVLAPMFEIKVTKSEAETAKSFAAMLEDDEFFSAASVATDETQVRKAVGEYVVRQQRRADDYFSDGAHNHDDQFDDMRRTGRLFGGLIADVKRKYNWKAYRSDWTDGWGEIRSVLKYISVTAWLYFAVIMPIIAFGALNDENTKKAIGVSETVLSQAIAGGLSAIFAGQPLAVTMTTGPVTVFIRVLYSWSIGLGIPFLPFYAWTGIWGAIILTIIVAFDLIAYVRYVGQFTEEIFAMLVALIFISNYIKPLVEVAREDPTDVFLLSFVLATGMYVMSAGLTAIERSYWLTNLTRTLLSDFGMPFSAVVWSAVRQIFTNVDVQMLEVPEGSGLITTTGRPWLVPMGDLPIGYIFLAIVPAIFLCMLFYVDQNVAVLLTNKKENKLKKGVGYFLDMQVIAVSMAINSILGIPWANAAVPHSALHARILADTEEYEVHGRRYERVVRAREVRITNLATHILIFASMFLLSVVGYIPKAVVWGFFLYIGIATLGGNQFWERCLLVFTQPEKYPPNHYIRRVRLPKIFLYTAIQLVLLVLLWFVNENFYLPQDGVFNAGLLFPVVIISFIPIRKLVLPKLFKPQELYALEMEKEDIQPEKPED